jgi:hypothetical protein
VRNVSDAADGRLEGSQTSPGRLDFQRLRRASRFGTWPRNHASLVAVPAGPQSRLNRRLPQTFRCVIRSLVWLSAKRCPHETLGKTTRAVTSGKRLFSTIFSLRRSERNIISASGTFQSGLPPGAVSSRVLVRKVVLSLFRGVVLPQFHFLPYLFAK